MTAETYDIVLGARVSKRIRDRILGEQSRIAKVSGIRPSLNEVVRLLIESGLDARKRR